MEEFLSEITLTPNMILISAAVYVIGMGLKLNPKVPDYLIIWILIGVGIMFQVLLDGVSGVSIVSGIVSTGLAVTTYQTIKQTKEGININRNN